MHASLNVLQTPLKTCSNAPRTGWMRDGCCNTDASDRGSHTVCARVTQAFLEELKRQGNDLITPAPEHRFPGLKAGDQWCVCAGSWLIAYKEGRACPVDLEATHIRALAIIPLEHLLEHAFGGTDA